MRPETLASWSDWIEQAFKDATRWPQSADGQPRKEENPYTFYTMTMRMPSPSVTEARAHQVS